MRLQRGVLVAGVAPALARDIARACHLHPRSTEFIANRVDLPVSEVRSLLVQLTKAGFVEEQNSSSAEGVEGWQTTIAGGALTMASFRKPISRARAEVLLAGVVERVAAYNTDDTKLLVVTELSVFGSLLNPEVAAVGDLDLAVRFKERRPEALEYESVKAFGEASGRSFSSLFDWLAWPEKDLLQLLRDRSPYINVHTEDVSRFTDPVRVVYRRPADGVPAQQSPGERNPGPTGLQFPG